jgi:hypothetical protein
MDHDVVAIELRKLIARVEALEAAVWPKTESQEPPVEGESVIVDELPGSGDPNTPPA